MYKAFNPFSGATEDVAGFPILEVATITPHFLAFLSASASTNTILVPSSTLISDTPSQAV